MIIATAASRCQRLQNMIPARPKNANIINNTFHMMLRLVSAATKNKEPNVTIARHNKEQKIKPFSAIPGHNRHWLLNVLEILFAKGGLHKSLFNIPEKIFR